MANKKRLIDADEFAKTLEKTDANVCADYGDGFCEFGYSRTLLTLLLSESPTVDAVEVVQCKDCIHYKNDIACSKHSRGSCEFDNERKSRNHFCSYGERRVNV